MKMSGEWDIPLDRKNNKNQKISGEFTHLQTKLFIRIAIIMFVISKWITCYQTS